MPIPSPAAARPVRLAALLGGAALLASCETITVRPDDPDPPVLTVSLPNANGLQAHYSVGTFHEPRSEPLSSFTPIDPTRPLLNIAVAHDLQPIQLLFSARDPQTGIRNGQGAVRVTFSCTYLPGPGLQSRYVRGSAYFVGRFGSYATVGSSTRADGATVVEFTLEQLWREAVWEGTPCPADGANTGLANIVIIYDFSASNNRIAQTGIQPPGGTNRDPVAERHDRRAAHRSQSRLAALTFAARNNGMMGTVTVPLARLSHALRAFAWANPFSVALLDFVWLRLEDGT